MCGIAGLIRLSGRAPIPAGILQRMTGALVHRGPDDQGFLERAGVAIANTRLSIVGLDDGHQPVLNENRSVAVVFNGEIFDYPELRQRLQEGGHRVATRCDAELIPHLWEDHQERFFDHLRGQFAFALHDGARRRVILARDRFGILPLYWSRQISRDGEWLLFASEIKALLASGLVSAVPDPRGIDQVFHFFAVPGPATCFAGVQTLQPGHYLRIDLAEDSVVQDRIYWSMDFPDRGNERDGDESALTTELDQTLRRAVEHRLRADVPVVSYVSGGVDSSLIAAMAATIRGAATPMFTVRIDSPTFDESVAATLVARHIGAEPNVVTVNARDVVSTYPELIRAAEAPVIDTAAAATVRLAREVHRQGYKVALAGEGSDEWLAGYPWHKAHRLFGFADAIPGVRLSGQVRRLALRAVGVSPAGTRAILGSYDVLGHHSAFHDVYGLMTAARYTFFHPDTQSALEGHNPYLELQPDLERMRRWHWINQSAYWAGRIHLPGHLLSLKGDRPAMHSSVETRYPFLDENVFALISALHPRWKLRGFRDKYILRRVAERYLPRDIAWRRKVMFRAPLDSFFSARTVDAPRYVDELLSEDSLRHTKWFAAEQVQRWRQRVRENAVNRPQRTMVQLGLVGVLATQLWYHTFIERLTDLPGWRDSASPAA